MPTRFQFVPPSGSLSGASFESQVEQAFDDLGEEIDNSNALAQQAVDTVTGVIATANNALNVANNASSNSTDAINRANEAFDVASDANTTANNASSNSTDAINRANEAFDVASDANTTANTAISTANTANDNSNLALITSQEARNIALNAESTAESAVQMIDSALGAYVSTTEEIDADDYGFGPYKMFIENTASSNFPGALPGYFTVFNDSSQSVVTQFYWSQNASDIYKRTGVLENNVIPGTSSVAISAIPDVGAETDGIFEVTASTSANLTGTFDAGTIVEVSSDSTNFTSTLNFVVADFTNGTITLNGLPIISVADGNILLLEESSISVDNGYLTIADPELTVGGIGFTVIFVWTDVSGATFGDWELLGGGVPAGVITMWSGAIVNIPIGWSICDGTNGTPDLRNMFVVGAGDTYTPGDSDPAATHTHDLTIDGTVLTVAQLAQHKHDIGEKGYFSSGSLLGPRVPSASTVIYSQYVGSNTAHTHTGEAAAASSLPPYYALAYIMKL